jgi:hypothetical protein
MQDSFYIALISIFAVFVIAAIVWLFVFVAKRPAKMTIENLSESEKELLSKFCAQAALKKQTIAIEKQNI